MGPLLQYFCFGWYMSDNMEKCYAPPTKKRCQFFVNDIARVVSMFDTNLFTIKDKEDVHLAILAKFLTQFFINNLNENEIKNIGTKVLTEINTNFTYRYLNVLETFSDVEMVLFWDAVNIITHIYCSSDQLSYEADFIDKICFHVTKGIICINYVEFVGTTLILNLKR